MALSFEDLSGAQSPQPAARTPNVLDVVRQQADLEATLPPTPVRELLAASGATLYVLATDAGLVATIRSAVGDRYPLSVVESWAELKAAAESGRCGIALLDIAALGPDAGRCLASLAAHADRLVTLVAADRAAAQQYVGLLSDGRIYRLLIKPLAVGATRLLIASATTRRLQLREESANDGALNGPVAASSKLPSWRRAVAAASAVALLGAAIAAGPLGWWDRFGALGAIATPAATIAAPATAPTPLEVLSDLHARAALAHQEGRLVEPVGDNALDHYLAILALAPTDQAARGGVLSVVETLFTLAEEALLADSPEAAAAALDHVRRAEPASSRLAFLDAQLARALAALAAPPPAPVNAAPARAAAPTELDSVLSLATARLRRGQLVSPAGDSARSYLERAAALDAADPRVATLRADLAAALVAAARLLSDADVAAATSLATEALALGAEPAALADLERDIGAARAREEQQRLAERLEAARARVQSGALFSPASDSALDHLLRLQADAPDLAGLADTWETFRAAGVLVIQGSLERREWAAAEGQLVGLTRAPGGSVVAEPLAAELTAGRLQETYLATAARATELELRSSVPVDYPRDALGRAVEGWVDLEYVVDRTGQPRNLVVVQASPPGRFDAAALAAVEQYRYVPFERDGRVYERRLRLRVRFQVQNVQ
jgi:protein TonB